MAQLLLHPVARSLLLVPMVAFTISVLQFYVQSFLNSHPAIFDFGPVSDSIKALFLNVLPMLMVAAFRAFFPRLIVADVPLPWTRASTDADGNKVEEMLWGSASTWFTVCFLGLRPVLNWLFPTPPVEVRIQVAAAADGEDGNNEEEENGGVQAD